MFSFTFNVRMSEVEIYFIWICACSIRVYLTALLQYINLCNGVTHGYPSLTFLNVTTAQLDIHQTQSIISHPKMKQI